MAARGIARGGQEALQYLGYDVGENNSCVSNKNRRVSQRS